eukprot:760485-Hanusia_phi.AAC.5
MSGHARVVVEVKFGSELDFLEEGGSQRVHVQVGLGALGHGKGCLHLVAEEGGFDRAEEKPGWIHPDALHLLPEVVETADD